MFRSNQVKREKQEALKAIMDKLVAKYRDSQETNLANALHKAVSDYQNQINPGTNSAVRVNPYQSEGDQLFEYLRRKFSAGAEGREVALKYHDVIDSYEIAATTDPVVKEIVETAGPLIAKAQLIVNAKIAQNVLLDIHYTYRVLSDSVKLRELLLERLIAFYHVTENEIELKFKDEKSKDNKLPVCGGGNGFAPAGYVAATPTAELLQRTKVALLNARVSSVLGINTVLEPPVSAAAAYSNGL